MMHKTNRRTFLKQSALAGAALSLPAYIRAASEGANSDIRIAVVGFNGRGQSHIKAYSNLKGVRIVALCDVDSNVLDKGVAQLAKANNQVKPFKDIRKLLDSGEVDAISIATPNHWHSLAGIWGIQAGKDVYVEKPVSHNVWEGRQLVKAADKYQRIVQMGVQSRSAAGIANVLEWLKSEPLGKLQYVRGLCYKRRPSIGLVTADQPVPETIDYDIWSGPAPLVPPHRKKIHYDWHWIWNYGNGDLGNQGIHQMDIARRFTGEAALSPKIVSVGGRLGYKDDGETPNSMFVFHDYEKAPLIFEVRGLPEKTDAKEMDKYRGASIGVIAQYENGYVVVPDYNNAAVFDNKDQLIRKYGNPPGVKGMTESNPISESEKAKIATSKFSEKEESHFGNFIACVKSRKAADLNAKIIDGHISSALCHTANISYRLGKTASPDELREKFKGNKEALDSLERLATHLKANDVDINVDKLTLGEFLKMDPKTERFIDNAAADKMLTREYRKPYVVPENV
ncbi:oxidoreductase domain protein [Chthoniobacter flavus Ellin428]|uniref:Oxidoreductase domain protein n=1 Tax=Chthoniobacter flavus Ellin428 TaxID=497964 RepID=B4DAV8_9BACT|nr:Gfo/Idh/MocA family oxidoreductase [Chthoniobacter flavus]EDY16430.1 oxidoreductase domain protein [Chthoniobacter flavus Ellin428]TCO84557.1 secreted protein [Chthoniobacter flavus]